MAYRELCGERYRALKENLRKIRAEGVKMNDRAVKEDQILWELMFREELIGRQIQYEKARGCD